jgi:CRP-like cAMP-binding protein
MEPMQAGEVYEQVDAMARHFWSDILDCSVAADALLSHSSQSIDFREGDVVFSQAGICKGLYLIVSGRFLRRMEGSRKQVWQESVGAGELVEVAAALGGYRHNYTLSAQTAGSVVLLPAGVLKQAFQSYPPLRMRLLGELAHEVSLAYGAFRSSCEGKLLGPHSGKATA